MKRQLDPLEILRDMRQGGTSFNVPIPHVIFLSLCNILMGASIWRMVLSGFIISAWYFDFHLQENYCKALSPMLTIIIGWECSWYDLAVLTCGEAMKPTFGKQAYRYRNDIIMPADDYCLYHCINYVLSNGGVKPTQATAISFLEKVAARLRDAGLSEQATRLLLPGSAGYPDEPDFAAIAAEAGFSFAIVQEGIPAPLVYGSEHGRVRMTVRRHSVADGAGIFHRTMT